MIYLDYQATTPLAPEAFDAMLPWLRDQHANPHSSHRPGRAAKAAVEIARDEVAALLPPGGRVAFTSGATEALNWAIKGMPELGRCAPIVTVATEHAAVLDTFAAEVRLGREVTVLPVGHDGLVDVDRAREAIRPGTGLVAAMLVNNEIGVVQPVAALAELAREAGALFLCDAVQGYGRAPIPPTCDLVAVSAHKVYGPKGVGALWVRDGLELAPLLHGGGQEALGRSGTLSPALCAGFGVAARLMRKRAGSDAAHVERLWSVAMERLALPPLPFREGLGVGTGALAPGSALGTVASVEASSLAVRVPTPGPSLRGRGEEERTGESWCINGSPLDRYHGNLNLRRAGLDVARLMSDLRDVAFSAGSACASGSGRPSHVLRAIGLVDRRARESIRFGWGRYTSEAELADALDRLGAAVEAQGVA